MQHDRRLSWATPALLLLFFVLLYALPILLPFANGEALRRFGEFNWSGDGWGRVFVRSICFATASTLTAIMIGFFGAVALVSSSQRSKFWLPLLLCLPLLGSTVVGFIFKMDLRTPLLYTLISDRAFWPSWIMMLAVQCWEFSPLFALLFSLQISTIPTDVQEFMHVSGASWGETIRDVYWPRCSDLASLLVIFSLSEGLGEYVKFSLILRASSGTGTEMLGTWLDRFYFTLSSIDPGRATIETLAVCASVFMLSLLVVAPLIICLRNTVGFFATLAAKARTLPAATGASESAGPVAAGFALLPVAGLLPFVGFTSEIPWPTVFISVGVSLLAVVCILFFTISFGISARVLLQKRLSRFSSGSLPVFLLLFSLKFIPPLGLVLCGFFWLGLLRQSSQFTNYGVWILAQSIVAFPVVATFVQFTHFRVSTSEVHLHRLAGSRLAELAKVSFLLRFKREYGLIALFSLSLILTESVINSIMAFQVPSIAHELSLRIDGRSGSFEEATTMIGIMAIPLALGVYLWATTVRSIAKP